MDKMKLNMREERTKRKMGGRKGQEEEEEEGKREEICKDAKKSGREARIGQEKRKRIKNGPYGIQHQLRRLEKSICK